MKKNNTLIQPNEISESTKVSMRTRIITAIVAIIIAAPLLLLGDWFVFVLVAFILFVGTYEIIHCAKRKYNPALYIVTMILAAIMTFWPVIMRLPGYFKDGFPESFRIFNCFDQVYISLPVIVLGVFAVFFMTLIDKGFTVHDACYIFTMTLVFSLGLQSAMVLRYTPSIAYHAALTEEVKYFNVFDNFTSSMLLLYIMIGTFMTDVGAYFIGIFFGKNKMNPRISPKKTWEGFFGGLIISCLVSFGFAMILLVNHIDLIPGVLDIEHWYHVLFVSLVLPPVATLGDFVYSSIKRTYQIKDFGNIMPGHGGILDRIDSLIFTFLASTILIALFNFWGAI